MLEAFGVTGDMQEMDVGREASLASAGGSGQQNSSNAMSFLCVCPSIDLSGNYRRTLCLGAFVSQAILFEAAGKWYCCLSVRVALLCAYFFVHLGVDTAQGAMHAPISQRLHLATALLSGPPAEPDAAMRDGLRGRSEGHDPSRRQRGR